MNQVNGLSATNGTGGNKWYYGVATTSRLLTIIGLFCKRALWKRLYSVKETYNFKEPTNRSHPIVVTALHFYMLYNEDL